MKSKNLTQALFVVGMLPVGTIDADSAFNNYVEAVVSAQRIGPANHDSQDLAWNVIINAPSFTLHALAYDPRKESAQALIDLFAVRGGSESDLLCAAAVSASRGKLNSEIASKINFQRCIEKAEKLNVPVDKLCRSSREARALAKTLEGEIRQHTGTLAHWCSP